MGQLTARVVGATLRGAQDFARVSTCPATLEISPNKKRNPRRLRCAKMRMSATLRVSFCPLRIVGDLVPISLSQSTSASSIPFRPDSARRASQRVTFLALRTNLFRKSKSAGIQTLGDTTVKGKMNGLIKRYSHKPPFDTSTDRLFGYFSVVAADALRS